MNLALWLERAATRWPDRPALMRGLAVEADYAGFRERAAALGAYLRARGFAPGDRVALFMKNCPEYLIALYGCWYAGLAAVPINAKLHPKEAGWILENSGAVLCFTTPGLEIGLEIECLDVTSDAFAQALTAPALPPDVASPDTLAWLFYTSGTTGRPKGVCITHGMLAAVSLAYTVDVDPVTHEDAAYYAAPMSHGAGLYALVHVLHGAGHICPPSGGFVEDELLGIADAHGSLSMFMAPTMVHRLTAHARRTGQRGEGLRTIVYGGGPMYRADIEAALATFGPRFVQIYGQGECPMAITALPREEVAATDHPDWAARIASVGRAQSISDVCVLDDAGAPVQAGEVGEIAVRGLGVMPEYWQAPDASAATLRNGWLLTGDMGSLDAQGYVTLKDRSKDMIISGGTNIYPREVEEALLTHANVSEVSVIGRASPEWGEEVVAYVVASPDCQLDEAALDAHCRDQIARFKRPRQYRFVEALPKNAYGKILKAALREQEAQRDD